MAGVKQIATIRTGNEQLDRVQDLIAGTLNPVLREVFRLPSPAPVVTGSKGGNAALASLISALAALGLVKDQTT